MGFDKPDLGFVVHLGVPQSPVAYYQQIGRAGRGVARADVIALPGSEDADIWAYFGSLAFPHEHVVRVTLAALADARRPLSLAALETRVDLSRSRLEMMLKVLDVDGAVRRVSGGWEATGQPWVYEADRYAQVAAERRREQQAMLGYLAAEGCRMEYLRRELDDPDAAPCGRCDNCTGRHWPVGVSTSGAKVARERLTRPGVQVEPRKMWPAGMSNLGIAASGKIGANLLAETGRVVGRLTDLGWGARLRTLLAVDPEARPVDGPIPDDLLAAVVTVLTAWDWAARPAAVVSIPSRSCPRLVAGLAERIAAIGRIPCLGSLAYASDTSVPRQFNSAQRLRTLWRDLVVPEALAESAAHLAGPVLLVDDRIETGWTMTVAAKLLREAGAPAVLPFALAISA
jgi:ATP-dependent DNA helicase RecQ